MSKTTRAVSQYENGAFLAQYTSVAVAAGWTGSDPSHIAKVARGDRKQTGGFTFRYISTVARGRGIPTRVLLRDDNTNQVVAMFNTADTAARFTGFATSDILTALAEGSTIEGYRVTYQK
jgi:hypothetical protein